MKRDILAGVAMVALSMALIATQAFSQSAAPTEKPESPEWFLLKTEPERGAGGAVADQGGFVACKEVIARVCSVQTGPGAWSCLAQNSAKLSAACKTEFDAGPISANDIRPPCSGSPICAASGGSGAKGRVEWKQTLGYTFSYPYTELPAGGGVSAVDLDSKGNLWAFQRNAAGKPQLFKFGPDHKLVLALGDNVLTHQFKPHGIRVDAEDNVWICDADGATIKKISPEGKVLLTLGERGKRGDWDEAKGQRLLWQPVHIDFASNGDVYIFEGHANESPNDTGLGDPTNNLGSARVIHLDKNLKFINQWYGNTGGPGKFYQTHGSAVDPKTGEVWIGDREEYRIVVYDARGDFLRTIQTRNLVCALHFDKQGQLWMGSGQDGQYLKIDRNGNVLGAVGNGPGRGEGQFSEASYFATDAQGNIYAGATGFDRITLMIPPKK